jgi:hypothetical protein
MHSPFDDYTQDETLSALQANTVEIKSTLDFLRGNHWQEGRVWVGPPDPDVANRPTVLEQKIKPIFVSKNIIKEIVEAHRDAVIGKEPDWSAASREVLKEGQEPSSQTQALIDEAEMLSTEWWDSKRIHDALKKAASNVLATGRGPLRLFVPKAYIAEDGTPAPGDLKTWLSRIFLTAADVDQQTLVVDEDSQQQAGVYAVQRDKAKHAEISFVDDDGKTILRTFDTETRKEFEGKPQDLGGNLLHFEMQREPIVSEQIRQNQALFNTTLTMRTRNVGVGGFPERTFLNARPPSHLEKDPDDPGKQIEVVDNFKVGAGVTNFVVGNVIEDEQGNAKGVTTASVSYRDPVNVDTFEKTEKIAYQNILEECRQLHRLIARDATASGESRIQARADFITSLRDTKPQVDAAGRWVVETALALAAALSGQEGRFSTLRFRFDSQLDLGPISSDERRMIKEETEGEKPLRSIQSAMKELGIDDPQAMLEEIASESDLLGAKTPDNPPADPSAMPINSGQPGQESTAVQ